MVRFSAGDDVTHTRLNALSNQSPARYVVFTEGGSYYGEATKSGDTSFSDTDYYTVLNDIVDALGMTGGRVHHKQGTYTLATQLDLTYNVHRNIHFTGEGVENTIITTSDDNLKMFVGAGIGINDNQQLYNCSWRDLTFTGTGNAGNGRAIDLTWGHYHLIANCRFEDFGDSCVFWDNIDNSYLTNNFFEGTVGNGFETDVNCGENAILGNQFEECEGYGVYFAYCYNNSFLANQITGNDLAGLAVIGGTGNQFIGNWIQGNVQHGITTSGTAMHIFQGNNIEGNDKDDTNTYDGLNVYNSAGCVIVGNEFADNDRDGIRIGTDADDNMIAYNHFKDNGGYDINIAIATADRNRLIGNVCESTNKINNAGTNTITDTMPMHTTALDLSGAATDLDSFYAITAKELIAYHLIYGEASSADAGVNVRVGRYQDGVALDDDYFDVSVSEVSQNKGYAKEFLTADLTQTTVAAGDMVTVGTAGGKTGTGTCYVKLVLAQV